MATPLGHSLAGYAVYSFSSGGKDHNRHNLTLLCIVMANFPDLDFLPGFLIGSPALYHQGVKHSLGFGLMVSMGIAGIYHFKDNLFSTVFTLCFMSYLSHLLINFLGPDGRLPYGQPLLWPLSVEHYIFPVSVFLGAHHVRSTSATTLEWIHGILNLRNLSAMSVELVLISPFIFLAKHYKRGEPG